MGSHFPPLPPLPSLFPLVGGPLALSLHGQGASSAEAWRAPRTVSDRRHARWRGSAATVYCSGFLEMGIGGGHKKRGEGHLIWRIQVPRAAKDTPTPNHSTLLHFCQHFTYIVTHLFHLEPKLSSPPPLVDTDVTYLHPYYNLQLGISTRSLYYRTTYLRYREEVYRQKKKRTNIRTLLNVSSILKTYTQS